MSELADFVLDAFRQAGGIVEPPAYAIYEVLLPEEVAHRWDVPTYQRLAFAGEAPPEIADTEDFTLIGYGHPLVDTLVEEIRAEPACTVAYVNDLRLEKHGLLELARQELGLTNARMFAAPHGGQAAALCHYVRFNFKAALITDEKRERLVSVVMDAQAGFAAPKLTRIEKLVRLEEKPAFGHLLPAPVRWLPESQAMSQPVLEGLLERATRAALDELAAPLETLRRRAVRHLELDRARLTEYYDDMAHDLERRITRSSDDGRRASLEDKLAATQTEREDKLADVEAKYRLRVELDLINLQVIVQPKILLRVQIGNRTAEIERAIVWDPLLHRIEPLACDACGRPMERLTLCSGGHLVHEDCLLEEQCIDCKRVYCHLCADQMGRCVVCDRPVCLHSLNDCDECGRATCREHVGLCHAADGEPARPAPPEPEPEPEEEEGPAPEAAKEAPKPPAPPPARAKKREGATKPTIRTVPQPVKKKEPRRPRADKIEVYVDPRAPVVNAFVLTKGKKQIAVRSWVLTDEGILVRCQCEKWYRCPADGRLLVPEDDASIEALIEAQIEDLRQEYGVSSRRIFRYAEVRGARRPVTRVVLRGEWR